jgi:hypothetical protein
VYVTVLFVVGPRLHATCPRFCPIHLYIGAPKFASLRCCRCLGVVGRRQGRKEVIAAPAWNDGKVCVCVGTRVMCSNYLTALIPLCRACIVWCFLGCWSLPAPCPQQSEVQVFCRVLVCAISLCDQGDQGVVQISAGYGVVFAFDCCYLVRGWLPPPPPCFD